MGQNIGRYTPDASTPGDLAMIMTPEQAALKAHDQFDALSQFVQQAAQDGTRIDTVERELFRQTSRVFARSLVEFIINSL
jgi:hypothetical protein